MTAIRYTQLRAGRRGGFAALVAALATLTVACSADRPDGHAPASQRGAEVVASGCGPVAEHGSGTAIGGDLLITAAHVVAGASSIEVRFGGISHPATIAAIDTDHDAAVLRVTGVDESPVQMRSAVAGEAGDYLGYGGLSPGVKPFTIARRITLDSEDIYVEGDHPRAGYELTADVEAGDSGAGLIVGGAVTGIVWARSEQADARAYAIDISVFDRLLDSLTGPTRRSPTSQTPSAPVPCP